MNIRNPNNMPPIHNGAGLVVTTEAWNTLIETIDTLSDALVTTKQDLSNLKAAISKVHDTLDIHDANIATIAKTLEEIYEKV